MTKHSEIWQVCLWKLSDSICTLLFERRKTRLNLELRKQSFPAWCKLAELLGVRTGPQVVVSGSWCFFSVTCFHFPRLDPFRQTSPLLATVVCNCVFLDSVTAGKSPRLGDLGKVYSFFSSRAHPLLGGRPGVLPGRGLSILLNFWKLYEKSNPPNRRDVAWPPSTKSHFRCFQASSDFSNMNCPRIALAKASLDNAWCELVNFLLSS